MQPTLIDLTDGVSPRARMRLAGDLRAPGELSVADLRAMPQRQAEATFLCRTSGVRRHHFTGPLLVDVARMAEPTFDASGRKDRLRFLVSVLGGDGHHAVLSWGRSIPSSATRRCSWPSRWTAGTWTSRGRTSWCRAIGAGGGTSAASSRSASAPTRTCGATATSDAEPLGRRVIWISAHPARD